MDKLKLAVLMILKCFVKAIKDKHILIHGHVIAQISQSTHFKSYSLVNIARSYFKASIERLILFN